MVTAAARSSVVEAATRIRLLATDCDGVLTDGSAYYSARGEELKRFSLRDGMGVERVRELAGVQVAIITRERSPIVAARALKLGITDLLTGVTDKLSAAQDLVHRYGITLQELAYIGDDVNDLELLFASGLSACPADAEPAVLDAVDLVCTRRGGHGAFRELAEVVVNAHAESNAFGPASSPPSLPQQGPSLQPRLSDHVLTNQFRRRDSDQRPVPSR